MCLTDSLLPLTPAQADSVAAKALAAARDALRIDPNDVQALHAITSLISRENASHASAATEAAGRVHLRLIRLLDLCVKVAPKSADLARVREHWAQPLESIAELR
jgi:hypothetical protein